MATVIRLQRGGRKKRPFYSIVVMDSRKRRDGAFIEKLGYYDPCREPDVIELNLERVKVWTDEGAQVSPRVAGLIKLVESPDLAEKVKVNAAEVEAAIEEPAEEAPAEEAAAAEPEKAEAAKEPAEKKKAAVKKDEEKADA